MTPEVLKVVKVLKGHTSSVFRVEGPSKRDGKVQNLSSELEKEWRVSLSKLVTNSDDTSNKDFDILCI